MLHRFIQYPVILDGYPYIDLNTLLQVTAIILMTSFGCICKFFRVELKDGSKRTVFFRAWYVSMNICTKHTYTTTTVCIH